MDLDKERRERFKESRIIAAICNAHLNQWENFHPEVRTDFVAARIALQRGDIKKAVARVAKYC